MKVKALIGRHGGAWILIVSLCLVCGGKAQQPQDPKQIPDAPSTTQPPQSFPTTPPEKRSPHSEAPASESESQQERPADQQDEPAPPPEPPPEVKTVPQGAATQQDRNAQDELYTLVRNVNQVIIPVMVQEENGRLVSGLLPKDFSVYENDVKQKLNFFSSDPLPLSAAVIFDLGMPDTAVQKVNRTFPALEGAFSQFDEVSIYLYSSTVAKATDFSAANQRLTAVLNELKTKRGRNPGPPVLGGPLGPQGPTVNSIPVEPSTPIVITPPKESHVLNDAVVAAALELSKRDRARRKIIFIISDGREYGSKSSYSDTLKLLLSHGIQVYGIGTESAAMPGFKQLGEKLHLPRFGYSDILPKYANATGGEVLAELSRSGIEQAYARALGDARNQYTLGYLARATPGGSYRQIEVRVARPGLKVTAKDGYYPLPPER